MNLYLASASPRRRQLLKDLGLSFKVVKSDYHEPAMPGRTPAYLVKRHAQEKARDVAKKLGKVTGLILAADTVVYANRKILGKPKHLKDAFRVLNLIQGKWHIVYTGVTLMWVKEGKLLRQKTLVQSTRVQLSPLDRSQMSAYFKKVNPLDKAGAYAIQSKRANIVKNVQGSFANAVGLPVEALSRYLL